MPIKVRVGQTDAIKILSSAGGGSISAQNATNVIGGIASVSQLSVSGVSTFGGLIDANANMTLAGNLTIQQYIDLEGNLDVNGHSELDDVNVSGAITATTFTGNLTGTATTALNLSGTPDIFVGIATATSFVGPLTGIADTALSLSGTPNITVGSVDASSLNVSGLTTLSANGGITTTGGDLYVGGDLFIKDDIVLDNVNAQSLNIQGISTFHEDVEFKKNVSIGGTLTYEDVTNVDSVGIVTAGLGLRVTAGGIIVTTGISTLNDTTQSFSTTTGALKIAGGVGIAKSVYIGGLLTAGLIDGGEF